VRERESERDIERAREIYRERERQRGLGGRFRFCPTQARFHLPHPDLLPLESRVADPLALLVAVGFVDITPI